MSNTFSPALIEAVSTLVIVLDRHLAGAAALVVLLLAAGVLAAVWPRR